jgi:hypothetical protein
MKIKTLLIAAALTLPLSAHAYRLDNMLNCDLSVRDFFAPLVQSRAIRTPAERIATNGNNMFLRTPSDALTFYRMNVSWVIGYSDDPLLFQHTADTEVPPDNYGIFVQASLSDVQAVMQSIGNTSAVLRRADTNTTLVVCKAPA